MQEYLREAQKVGHKPEPNQINIFSLKVTSKFYVINDQNLKSKKKDL